MNKLTAALTAICIVSLIGISGVANAETERGKISVNTTANTEIAPDVAEISFAIITSDTKSMQKAITSNKDISDKVLAGLKSMINTNNGDFIKTADFSANPLYNYNGSKKTLDKYEVSNRIIVHTKSINIVGKMIDGAISNGATNVANLAFSVSNYDKQCNELISIASKKALTRAEATAKAVSATLAGVSNISTSCSTNNNSQPRLYLAKNMVADVAAASGSEESSTTISNGVVKVNASVSATFFVK